MTVLFIALFHGIPVLVVGAWSKSRFLMALTALVAVIIAFATGNPAFTAADLLAVGLCFWMGLSVIRGHEDAQQRRREAEHRAHADREQQERARESHHQRQREEAARQARASAPRRAAPRTHYDNLQVTRGATPAVIKAAYRALVQRYHPDKFQGSPEEAARITKILNEAYAVLSDPAKRRAHDEWIDSQAGIAEPEEEEAPRGDGASRAYHSASPQPAPPSARPAPPDESHFQWIGIGAFVLAVVVLIVLNSGPGSPPTAPAPRPAAATASQPAPVPLVDPRSNPQANEPGSVQAKILTDLLGDVSRPQAPESRAPRLNRTPEATPPPAAIPAPPPAVVATAPPVSPPVQATPECRIEPYSSARASCPQASAQELRRLYVAMVSRKRAAGDTGFWEARSQEVFQETSNCASEVCVRLILYRAIDEIVRPEIRDSSPG